MPKILSFNHNPKVEKENVFKSLWESFMGLDLFIKMVIISLLLIAIVTPTILRNFQIFGIFAQGRTAQTLGSGNWFDPSVWTGGLLPATGDSVIISPGHTIIYNVLSDDVLGEIKIQGTLKFSRNTNTRLRTNDNIMVEMGGYLDMGTPQDYISKDIRSEITFVLTPEQTAAYVGGPTFQPTDKGLWVMNGGRWESHGAPLVRTWSKLSQDAPVGATSVVVENNVNDWYVGGTVVITPTNMPRKLDHVGRLIVPDWQDELRIITAIAPLANGRTQLTLNSALTFTHSGTPPMRGEVGLLTRNVVFKTELVGVTNAEAEGDPAKRKFAHTMYMNGSKGNINYTEFKYMGHVDTLGRYSVHPHQMADTSRGMVIRGNGLWYAGFRWVNIHSSNGILVEDNVGYKSADSGYFIEWDFVHNPPDVPRPVKGVNTDNSFIHNLGVRIEPVGEIWSASVFYVQSYDSTFLGNVAVGAFSGSDSAGFAIGEDATGNGIHPLFFMNNEPHSNFHGGFRFYNNNNPIFDTVGLSSWKNAGGYGTGGYTGDTRIFQSEFLNNLGKGVGITTVNFFFQDNVFDGNGSMGFMVEAYVAGTDPRNPNFVGRNIFKNQKSADFTQVHNACSVGDEKRPVLTGACSAAYINVPGNVLQSAKEFDFGWHANANSFWKVFDYTGSKVPHRDFVLLRKDQLDSVNQTDITKNLVNAQSFYSLAFDAVVTPMSSLPSTMVIPGLKDGDGNSFDFTFTTTNDLPPQADLSVTTSGTQATMNATATDDKGVARVEFWVDESKVAEKTSGPFTRIVDLANRGRKYTYLYVKAYDDKGQLAYSKVTELGPEVSGPSTGPVPTKITVSPASVFVAPGESQTFIAAAVDQSGNPIGINPVWSVSGGGSIGQTGVFTAGASEGGSFTVTATAGTAAGQAIVTIQLKNIALGKTKITSSVPSARNPSSFLTDGETNTEQYFGFRNTTPQWVKLDLENTFFVSRLNLRHYYRDARTYHDVILQISENDTNWTAVFNNDRDNSSGQGVGTDAEYAETPEGKLVVLPSSLKARFIRAWSNGNTVNSENHYVELEVYGAATGPMPTPTLTSTLTPIPTPTPIPPTVAPTPRIGGGITPVPLTPIPTVLPLITQIPTIQVPTIVVLPTLIPTPQPIIACTIIASSWTAPFQVVEGATVSLSATTNNAPSCIGKKIAFDIRQDNGLLPSGNVDVNPQPVDIQGAFITTSWVAEFHPNGLFGLFGSPKFFFNASIIGERVILRSDPPNLQVDKAVDIAIATTPQVISTKDKAEVIWETNKTGSSEVHYGLRSSYKNRTQELDAINRILSHSISVPNLKDCTLYHYRVLSRDAKQLIAQSSDFKFTTKGCNASVVATSETDRITDNTIGDILSLVDDTSSKGITVLVPKDFATSSVNFQILKLDKQEFVANVVPPVGQKVVGDNIYHLNGLLEDEENRIISFNKDITLKIKYDALDILGIDEDSLRIQRHDGEKWTELAGCTIDKQEKSISCNTLSFSDFALFGTSLEPTPTLTQAPSTYSTPSYGSPSSGGGGGWI